MSTELEGGVDIDGNSALREVLSRLPASAAKVHMTYYGSGDSGDIDEFDILDENDEPVDVEDDVEESVRDILWETFPNGMHAGWENNDGGRGTIDLDLKAGTYTYEHADYYTEEEVTNHEGKL